MSDAWVPDNAVGALHNPHAPNAIPGDYIVVLKQSARAEDVLSAHGLNPRHQYSHAFNGFAGNVPAGRLRALANDSRVVLMEPDVQVFALGQVIPTGVQRIGATLCPVAKIDGIDERVNADVAIIDTGIDLTHPDLNVYQHVSFTADSTDGNDGNGHGTHVAGIVGALDNNIGVVGVAPGARLWAVKVLDNSGAGALSTIIRGVDYVTQHADEIEVANMSLGGQGSSDSLRLAIQNSVAKGVVYVVAAGNSDFDIYGGDNILGTFDDFFPAAYPEVMTVSALADSDGKAGGTGPATTYGADDTLAAFSDYSIRVDASNPVSSPGAAIDVAAPGVNIYSTYKGGTYATMSGTSMASPHAAGGVALYIAQYGRAYNASGVYAIRQALINSAEPQSFWGTNPANPNHLDTNPEGLINVRNIGNGTLPDTPPTISITSPLNGANALTTGPVQFTGSASDAQDGDLGAKIVWRSSISGQIGAGADFSASLVAGTHVITATAIDSAGSSSSAYVTVYVSKPNTPPSVVISSPANGLSTLTTSSIQFTAAASDVEDGDLSAKIVWTSNLSGLIGSGATFTATLPAGTHLISATVSDSAGATVASTVTVTVGAPPPPNTPPSVSILSPANGAIVVQNAKTTFSGNAYDVEDGDITSKIVWTSSIDGVLGTGGSLTPDLSPGNHVITASVTDSGGITTRSSITLSVATPSLLVSLATDKTAYVHRDMVNLTVTVTSGSALVPDAAVTLVVSPPGWRPTTSQATTDSSGKAVLQYQVNSKRDGIGIYDVTATATLTGYNSGVANTTFAVTK